MKKEVDITRVKLDLISAFYYLKRGRRVRKALRYLRRALDYLASLEEASPGDEITKEEAEDIFS